MKKLLCAVVLFASFGWLSEADAVYVFSEDNTNATSVFRFQVVMCPGTTHTFETRNTTSGGDPVMHLVASSTELAYSDDTWIPAGMFWIHSDESKITYAQPSGGWICSFRTIIVRAYDNNTGGNGGKDFDFYWNGSLIGRFPVGGFQINPDSIVGAQETMETVLVNDGAPATTLLAFDYNGNHHAFRALNQTAGIGVASKLWGSNVADKSDQLWVVSTATTTTREGPVRVVRNDVAIADDDGDGLGNNLEVVGTTTCPNTTAITLLGFDCSTLTNAQDTDGDGLRDDWEVIGEDDWTGSIPALPSLLFPFWGADPLHKDVFIEVDATTNAPNLRESVAGIAAARYASLEQMQNPDGLPGIRLHFDLGFPCSSEPGDQDGISAVCGMFGGANVIPQTVGCSWDEGNMNANRLRRFHWGVEDGRASADLGGYAFCHNGAAGLFTHELGHNLGLEHWGSDWSGIANYKPQYPSMMSYAYQNKLNFSFSDGTRSTPIDPGNVNELATFGSAETDFMTASPFDYMIDPVKKNIDWNHDGSFDSSVKAHACCGANQTGGGGTDVPTNLDNENVLGSSDARIGPGAAAFLIGTNPGTYLVKREDATGRFSYSMSLSAVGGWTTWYGLGPMVHGPAAEPFAVPYDTYMGERLVIFGGTGGGIHYSLLSANGIHTDALGNAQGWTALPHPTNTNFDSVSAVWHGPYLYVVAREISTNEVWFGALRSDLVFFGWSRATLPDASIVKSLDVTPGAASARDGLMYVAVKQADPMRPRFQDIDYYTFDPTDLFNPTTGVWTHSDANVWLPADYHGTACQVSGRPAVVFRDHRTGSGARFSRGALWTYYAVEDAPGATESCWNGTNLYYRWSWGRFDSGSVAGVDFNMGRWWGAFAGAGACWNGPAAGSGVALANRDGALTAFTTNKNSCGSGVGRVLHLPYADGTGTPDRLLSDHNDYLVVEPGLCRSLNKSCPVRCDNPNSSCSSTITYDPVDCSDGPM